MFTLTTRTSHLYTLYILPEWLAERQLGTLATTVIIAAFTLSALEFGADELQTVFTAE